MITDIGGFGGAIFSAGDTTSRVLSRFTFMKAVLSMLFLVRLMDV
jgi:hypothetical protein